MGLVDLAAVIARENLLQHAREILVECAHLASGSRRGDGGASVFLMALMRCCQRDQIRFVAHLFDEFLPTEGQQRMSDLMDERLRMHIRCKDGKGFHQARVQAVHLARRGVLPTDYRFRFKKR